MHHGTHHCCWLLQSHLGLLRSIIRDVTSGEEHSLLLQISWVLFTEPIWQLTTVCASTPQESDTLFWTLKASGTRVVLRNTYSQTPVIYSISLYSWARRWSHWVLRMEGYNADSLKSRESRPYTATAKSTQGNPVSKSQNKASLVLGGKDLSSKGKTNMEFQHGWSHKVREYEH